MRRAIVGTAGHIDHGKTKLVEALTGIDCDRWAEEKRRGITIDLGFAHLEIDDLELGFIDVPGHEKFVHNALAGLGGIRVLLLVVAADEGVKPQTLEHLSIAKLLPIPAAVVALTRVDLATPELVEIARLEVEDLLAGTRFAGSPIFPLSSVSGEGVNELRHALIVLGTEHAQPDEPDLPARLPIDRAFHLTGRGVIVTGTLASGELTAGDGLALMPAGKTVRLRTIEVHGRARQRVLSGQRVALQLAGTDLEEIHRGDYLVSEDAFEASNSLLIHFQLLSDAVRPLAATMDAKLHLFSSEVIARLKPLGGVIQPGSTGLVEARLRRPLPAIRGDHVIVRRLSPAVTLGGGRILDPRWRRPHSSRLGEALAALASEVEDAVVWWAQEAKERGLGAAELSTRLGHDEEYSKSLLAGGVEQGKLTIATSGRRPPRYLSVDAVERLEKRARAVLQEFFARDRLATGMPKAELVSSLLPARGRLLADFYLSWLEERGIVSVLSDRVTLPERASVLSEVESRLAKQIVHRYEEGELTPPSPAAVAFELRAKPQIVDGVIRFLVERGTLVRLPGGLILAASSVDGLIRDLAKSGWERFSVSQFKERYGLSRKWAIPLLEYLDSTGVTRRIGDQRMLAARRG